MIKNVLALRSVGNSFQLVDGSYQFKLYCGISYQETQTNYLFENHIVVDDAIHFISSLCQYPNNSGLKRP